VRLAGCIQRLPSFLVRAVNVGLLLNVVDWGACGVRRPSVGLRCTDYQGSQRPLNGSREQTDQGKIRKTFEL
jgi:hypothetical protein